MKSSSQRSYYNIGQALCLLQQFADAELVFKEGLGIYPGDIALWHSLYSEHCVEEESSDDNVIDATCETPRQRIETSTISTSASYQIPARHPFRLIIVRGHVIDFSYPTNPEKSAIVNCANEVGINDAICQAGGPNLLNDPQRLTFNISYGNAYLTGPDSYGKLNVSHVIHAVGPNYRTAAEDSSYLDNMLSSAYTSSLKCVEENNIEAIAFSLLCADNRRGGRALDDVLRVGIESIATFEGYPQLKEVYMFASTRNKAETLLKLCTRIVLSVDALEDPIPTTASADISSGNGVSIDKEQGMNEVAKPTSSNLNNQTDSKSAEGRRDEFDNDQATLDENLDALAILVNRAAARLNLPFMPSDSGADIQEYFVLARSNQSLWSHP